VSVCRVSLPPHRCPANAPQMAGSSCIASFYQTFNAAAFRF
jgi:hypothetical protein